MGNYRNGYIEGATVWAERLKQERNKVIDECIQLVRALGYGSVEGFYIERQFKSLKDKSHE